MIVKRSGVEISVSITLCMVVKDEANRIEECLDPIHHLFDEIIIVDSGSTDGTPELLWCKYGIAVLHGQTNEKRCHTMCDAKNLAFSCTGTDWIFTLDADEHIDPESLLDFKAMRHSDSTAGYFGLWRNHVGGQDVFDDYKCFIFRPSFRARGLIHSNVQTDIREMGSRAQWCDRLFVDHFPDRSKHELKTRLYKQRLLCALKHNPEWYRYNWFLGYMQFKSGEWDSALSNLSRAFESRSDMFPVECLNSAMVQAEIMCMRDQPIQAFNLLSSAQSLWHESQADFEVAINLRMAPWIENALNHISCGNLREVKSYPFAL